MFFIPVCQLHRRFKSLEDTKGSAVAHGVLGDDWYPATLHHHPCKTCTYEKIHTIQIAQRQVAPVIDMQIDV